MSSGPPIYPYHYYRDHAESGAWGVRDGRTDKRIAIGLDKNVAAAVADLLNGGVGTARELLAILPERMEAAKPSNLGGRKDSPVGPEPEIVVGYKIGLGVAARINEAMAFGMECRAEGLEPNMSAIETLRTAAAIMRGEIEYFDHQRAESLLHELKRRTPADER